MDDEIVRLFGDSLPFLSSSLAAAFFVAAIYLVATAASRFSDSLERRFVVFVGVYFVAAYPLKLLAVVKMDVFDSNVGGVEILISSLYVLLFCAGLRLAANSVGREGEQLERKLGLRAFADSRFQFVPVYVYLILIVVSIALAKYSTSEIVENSYGVLSRQAESDQEMVAGFMVRIQDRAVPLALYTGLLAAILGRANFAVLFSLIGVLVAHLWIDASVRLTKGALLTGVLLLYFSIGELDARQRRVFLPVFLSLLLVVPAAFSYINYLRTDEVSQGMGSLLSIFDRIVGSRELLEIVEFCLRNSPPPLVFDWDSLPADTFFSNVILGNFGLHADAPGLFGYMILEFGLLLAYPVVFGFGFIVMRLLISINQLKDGLLRVILFGWFAIEVTPFLTDGNTALFAMTFSTLRRWVGLLGVVGCLWVLLHVSSRVQWNAAIRR